VLFIEDSVTEDKRIGMSTLSLFGAKEFVVAS
jgi:hypothetical protein